MDAFTRCGTARACRAASPYFAMAASALGALALLGWRLDQAFLKSIASGWVAMNPVTAAAFVPAGLSAWLLTDAARGLGPGRALASRACALLVVAVGTLRLAGYAFDWDIGVDRLLFSAALEAGPGGIPNRMAPNTAMGFVQLGAALFLFSGRSPLKILWAQRLSLFVAVMSLLALLGYAYGARMFYGVSAFIPMAAHSALAFLLLAAAVLGAEPEAGLMRVPTGGGGGGRSLRLLLPAIVVVPSFMGWLILRGQAAGYYGAELGTSLMVSVIVAALAAVIYWNADLLERLEEQREEAGKSLRAAHEALEARVRERTSDLARANEELKREIGAKAALQAQLVQAQKMEAVGRLAGGVAHDFNNLLTAISGYGYFLLNSDKLEGTLRSDVEEIMKAGDRAASLTRQLLAFSRQQVLRPRIVDLNVVVRDIEKMLRRLIGEDIRLSAVLSEDLGRVKADPGQIEQMIVNLVVNARDAMPDGGQITLETRNVELSEEYAGAHLGTRPGPHVMLAVSDTGSGMDAKTLSRLFEPFFTTKEQGKGTGLGLSTVYGIVKQSGGSIFVYSEPGKGSSFKIFLPRVEAEQASVPQTPVPARSYCGHETILLVEDDEAVRRFIRRLLGENGYRLLEARTPDEAFGLSRGADAVHLLLTDIVMPGMRGDDLAKQLGAERPGMKVVFISGYTEAGVVRHELLDSRAVFIQKPIDAAQLLQKVRELLDAGASGGPDGGLA